MRTLMSGDVWVHYGQIYVMGETEFGQLHECFAGQQNGLCGAALPGVLFLITGTHTGQVGFAIELHDEPPPIGDTWEEIVEVSYRADDETALVGWAGENSWPLDLEPGDHRVRYCGTRMDEAHDGTRMDDEPEIDRYLLQFWPAPPEPDRVLKQTSANAAYWHDFASNQPPPPTPEEKAEAERQELLKREREIEQARIEAETRKWGGRLPSERLRNLVGNARSVALLDRPLADALADADPAAQRQVARWVARHALSEAQLADVDWIAAALAALDRDDALPEPFENHRAAWDRLLTDERVPRTLVTSLDGTHHNLLQQAMAFPALLATQEEDPLRAALDALWAAVVAFGRGRTEELFAEVRRHFPAIA